MKNNYILAEPLFTNESIVEPITLEEAKNHIKVSADITDDDDLITALIKTARKQCERYTNTSLIERTVTVTIQNDLGNMLLPYQPMRENREYSTDFISIVDDLDNAISSSNYKLIGQDFKLIRTIGVWGIEPTPRNNYYTPCYKYLTVSYNAGYVAGEVPEDFRTAIKQQVDWLYNNRGAETGQEMSPVAKAVLSDYHWERVK